MNQSARSLSLLVWVTLASSLNALSAPAAPAPEAADPLKLERFQSLLSAPPVVVRMVYAKTLPRDGLGAPFLESGLAGSSNRELYELRWQTNAMFHRQLNIPEQATNQLITGRCFSLWNDRFYFLDAQTAPALYVLEREKAAQGVYAGPYHAAHIRMVEAAEPLTLGVSHLYPGMIQWKGQEFTVESMADKKPNWIRGGITGFSNGIPTELKVQYSNDMGVAHYRITYDYAAYSPPYFPSRIGAHFIRNGREILYAEYAILSLITAQEPLAESHYNAAARLFPQPGSLLYYTNSALYARLPSGSLIEAPTTTEPTLRFAVKDYFKNRYYYLATLAWTLSFLVLGFRVWQNSKSRQTRCIKQL